MKRTPVTFLSVVFFAAALAAAAYANAQELFQYRHTLGQKYRIEGFVDESIYRNNVLVKRVRFKNFGNLAVSRISGDRAFIEGVFSTYRSETVPDNFVLEREYPTEFYRDKYGNYEISDEFFMPVVRGVPAFPARPLEVGDQWTSKASEAHDFRDAFGIRKPVVFPAAVAYQYLGNVSLDGERVAKLSINYVINHTMTYGMDPGVDVLPRRIVGYFNQLFHWNLDKGLPHSYRENFDYIFIMSNGEIFEYTGSSRGTLTVSENPGEDETQVERIRNLLKANIPSVEVTQSDQGIVINIGEILFKFDSDELTPDASRDLDNIVSVLQDFQDRSIRVIGHTDSTGPEDYNLNLSLRRARRTALELKNRAAGSGDRITFIGMGEHKPIADNATEEGRRKNRRVEIIILKK